MKKLLAHRLTLVVEIIITLAACGAFVFFSLGQLQREAASFDVSVDRDYTYIIDGYKTAFSALCLHVEDEIEDDLSLEEMSNWLQNQAPTFRRALGAQVFDDFYFTYKGGFVHSWPQGDFSNYVPSSRGWYQAAQKAGGRITVIPPYKSYIGDTTIMSLAKKYNEDISFGLDLKVPVLSNLLLNRNYNYPNSWLILADARGDVLSSNQNFLLKHNLFKVEGNISPALVTALREAQARNGQVKLARINGSYMLTYAFFHASGSNIFFLMPWNSFFQEHLAPIFIFALLLIALEIAFNIIYRRRLHEGTVVAAAKDDFLSRMSHDIRTPLNGVIGMTQLAREENSNPRVADYLRKIDISSHYLLGLVNDILDLSKISAGKMELHPEPYREEDFLQYLDSIILPMCAEKNLHFTAPAFDFKQNILVDKLKYNQIYFNLLSNAVKYTPAGGHIHMEARNVRYENGYMVFDSIVSDDGIGMSEDFQKKMFDPFEQEKSSRGGHQQGSGLGLSIVKKLVDLLDGTIEVQSSPGKGTTFILHLRLPLAPDNLPADAKAAPLDESLFRGKTFLVAEDNEINSQITLSILQKKGVQALRAVNGQDAVEKFAASLKAPPALPVPDAAAPALPDTEEEKITAAPAKKVVAIDAILMDVQMPIMDGKEATQMIRALPDPKAQQVPIIALTANAYDEDVKSCLDAGMDAHVAKPIEPDKLFQTLAAVPAKKELKQAHAPVTTQEHALLDSVL